MFLTVESVQMRGGGASMKTMAFSASNDIQMVSAGGGEGPQGQIRTEFPETWIWKSAYAGYFTLT